MFKPEVYDEALLVSMLGNLTIYSAIEVLWLFMYSYGEATYVHTKVNLISQMAYVAKSKRKAVVLYIFGFLMYSFCSNFDQLGHDWSFNFEWCFNKP